jgi:dolichol-phosphate mannosyltransferase
LTHDTIHNAANGAPPGNESQPGFELSVVVPAFNEAENVAPLIKRLEAVLAGVRWQVIYVDDNSPDGTAEVVKAIALTDPRVSCLRRVGRRGLAGAIMEGMLAAAAPYVAVIDADLQHDERLLRPMLGLLQAGTTDLVIASRYVGDGDADAGFSALRAAGSRFATRLARHVLKSDVSDPVSGFFALRREVLDTVAPKLSTQGFKILFDLISAHGGRLRIRELPYHFRERHAGTSKLDSRVVIDYLGLILARASHNLISPRLLLFGLVGASGIAVHVAVLQVLPQAITFLPAQFVAALVAMTTNFFINNAVTYRDRRKRGLGLITGYLQFCALCSVGFLANLAVANQLEQWLGGRLLAGAVGASFGAVWNYVTTALAVW